MQINLGLLLLGLVIITFYQTCLEAFFNIRKIEEDLEIHRVHRLLISNLEQKITYQAAQVSLSDNGYGTQLVCQLLGGGRLTTFYCRPNGQNPKVQGLYIATENTGEGAGVNPLTAPSFAVHSFRAAALNRNTLQLTLELGVENSSRTKRFTEVITLCNGTLK